MQEVVIDNSFLNEEGREEVSRLVEKILALAGQTVFIKCTVSSIWTYYMVLFKAHVPMMGKVERFKEIFFQMQWMEQRSST